MFRKELTEWLRGPKALIIAGVSIAGAVFMTLIPYIARATGESEAAGLVLTMDPTTNVLLGWTGLTVALIAIVATMALVSAERDRGTLAWSLTNPVSPTSIIAAKFSAAFLVFSVVAVLLPLRRCGGRGDASCTAACRTWRRWRRSGCCTSPCRRSTSR